MNLETELAIHEQVCEERYKNINRRLDDLDHKFDDMGDKLDAFKSDIYKIMIGCATSIIVCLITVAVTTLARH